MNIRVLFLGVLSTACFVLVSACGEVEHCKRGDLGCVDGLPDDVGECRFGLVEDPITKVCVEPDHDAGPPRDPNAACVGGCATGEACRADGTCINVCAQANAVAPRDSLLTCRPAQGEAAYDLAKAAHALCVQGCTRRNALCTNSPCDPAVDCTAPQELALAAAACATMPPTVECVMARCEMVRDQACDKVMCPGSMPNCAGVTCTNTCSDGTQTLNFDGLCDDGDLTNAVSAICPWGSDCGDCGPRRGAAPAKVKQIGEQCIDPYQCGASYDNFSDVPGWCVVVDQAKETERCVPDCSVHGVCPAGYTCRALEFKEADGSTMTLRDENNLVGSACFPMQCGM
jgi:hypothetical protein